MPFHNTSFILKKINYTTINVLYSVDMCGKQLIKTEFKEEKKTCMNRHKIITLYISQKYRDWANNYIIIITTY
jgi:hypothetical protein